ncbi:MAG: FdtA/QdtA family cupin domain-containing protein [Gemmatimonadaceae bacterium]|nr:FdtA/QdtA family cupin domain-containing protein [Gemmatimonadaceae bacterium]
MVVGNPARVVRWTGTGGPHQGRDGTRAPQAGDPPPLADLRVNRCRLVRLPVLRDGRGLLSFGEHAAHLPFPPLRYFLIAGVPQGSLRGEHAHRELEQFLICAHGSCRVVLEDGTTRDEILLDSPGIGVYIAPMTWTTILHDSPDTTVLVLASDTYREADYIREYAEFLSLTRSAS